MDGFVSDASHAKFILWLLMGCISLIGSLLLIIGYFWRQNTGLRDTRQQDTISTIKDSIDNLSKAVIQATTKFEHSMEHMWNYIGDIDTQVSWLVGQHEANHKNKAPQRERRKDDHLSAGSE